MEYNGTRAMFGRYRAARGPSGAPRAGAGNGCVGAGTGEPGDSCLRTARNQCKDITTTIATTIAIITAQPTSCWRFEEVT